MKIGINGFGRIGRFFGMTYIGAKQEEKVYYMDGYLYLQEERCSFSHHPLHRVVQVPGMF